jgi:hypothetical protein
MSEQCLAGRNCLCGAGFPAWLSESQIMAGWKACPTCYDISTSKFSIDMRLITYAIIHFAFTPEFQ